MTEKHYTLIGPDGQSVLSAVPGTLGGNRCRVDAAYRNASGTSSTNPRVETSPPRALAAIRLHPLAMMPVRDRLPPRLVVPVPVDGAR